MKKRVLIFDDDADILEVCAIVLETNGFEVISANNCDNILENIGNNDPDVVLMDNKIPPLGGIQASQTIKEKPFDLDNLVATLNEAIAKSPIQRVDCGRDSPAQP